MCSNAILGQNRNGTIIRGFADITSEVGKSSNVWALLVLGDSCLKGSWVTCLAVLLPPLATPTRLLDCWRMDRPVGDQSFLLM